MEKIEMYHPTKWGNFWYMKQDDSVPFKFVDGLFIEQPPIHRPKDWVARAFRADEVEIQGTSG